MSHLVHNSQFYCHIEESVGVRCIVRACPFAETFLMYSALVIVHCHDDDPKFEFFRVQNEAVSLWQQ